MTQIRVLDKRIESNFNGGVNKSTLIRKGIQRRSPHKLVHEGRSTSDPQLLSNTTAEHGFLYNQKPAIKKSLSDPSPNMSPALNRKLSNPYLWKQETEPPLHRSRSQEEYTPKQATDFRWSQSDQIRAPQNVGVIMSGYLPRGQTQDPQHSHRQDTTTNNEIPAQQSDKYPIHISFTNREETAKSSFDYHNAPPPSQASVIHANKNPIVRSNDSPEQIRKTSGHHRNPGHDQRVRSRERYDHRDPANLIPGQRHARDKGYRTLPKSLPLSRDLHSPKSKRPYRSHSDGYRFEEAWRTGSDRDLEQSRLEKQDNQDVMEEDSISLKTRKKGKNVHANVSISLREAYLGCSKRIRLETIRSCIHCNSSNNPETPQFSSDPAICTKCQAPMPMPLLPNSDRICSNCSNKPMCSHCKNRGTVKVNETLTVHIQPGTVNMQCLLLPGKSFILGSEPPGDVILTIAVRKEKGFTLKNHHLIVHKEVKLYDALFGTSLRVKHLDDRILELKTKTGEIIRPKSVFRVDGEGMRDQHGNPEGHLYITFSIRYPSSLGCSPELLRQLAEFHKKDPDPAFLEHNVKTLSMSPVKLHRNSPRGLRKYFLPYH